MVPVREVAGEPVAQVVIGSSANPGLRDFAIAAAIVADRQTSDACQLRRQPDLAEILQDLTKMGATFDLIARRRAHPPGRVPGLHRHGPSPGHWAQLSLRTFPRNFPGRSGTPEDAVWLCSPGDRRRVGVDRGRSPTRATSPATWIAYPGLDLPARPGEHRDARAAAAAGRGRAGRAGQGPEHLLLPELDPLPDRSTHRCC